MNRMPFVVKFPPVAIRLKDAPSYLGMDKNRFNQIVRPHISEFRYGKQSVVFDRLELEDWWEQYKSRNGCPCNSVGEEAWDTKSHPVLLSGVSIGTLTKGSEVKDFESALAQASSKKQKPS